MRKTLLKFIDFFHPPFARLIPLHTFRYLASGGTTALMGVVIYYIAYNFILGQQDVRLPFVLVTAPIAALIIELCITFPMGFLLNKYLVFTQSTLRGRQQLFRYATVVFINILLNYALIKLMVETLHFYPTIAKFTTTCLLTIFSYFSQKHFSFRVGKKP
ncbi:phenylalanine 4-monooxygenase [Pedobacter yulinensis]|uniref:Phenylalanine 4-monooxygenase n=1 Tax=Pedobacter yulinensis TaxID=2126353 RepID=A0A2T3HGL7_9SPHI|nr:GtrA family protein [Pedobacter yulinensis]PST81572.1 phenylalanine 4-monooxygenase [Pedobacter yulinensis]